MAETDFEKIEFDGMTGKVRKDIAGTLTARRLSRLRTEVENAKKGVLSRGRHQVVVLDLGEGAKTHLMAVKLFGRQSAWKDRYDKRRGSKAARSFDAASFLQENKVGTPEPLAYIERWEGTRLCESFYLSEYLPELENFRDALWRIYQSQGPCSELVDLLQRVAPSLRQMHDAGFCHRDLGNQNIELLPQPIKGKPSVFFLDLNRGRIRKQLSKEERAKDFSRLKIPSDFFNIFMRIYWQEEVPTDFRRIVEKFRRRFDLWQRSRAWRRPIKSLRQAREDNPNPLDIPMKDIWIWDDRSAQASIIHNRVDARKYHSRLNLFKIIYSSLKALRSVKRNYEQQLTETFKHPINLSGRVGMSLEPTDLDFETQLKFLEELGDIPVLLRFGHHEGTAQWDRSLNYLNLLHERGHPIMVAVLQDRRAILNPNSWSDFLNFLFKNISGKVSTVEIGHVVNRTKWGIHNLREYRVLMEPVVGLREKYPEIEISGPACIDFEFHHSVAALDNLPKGLNFDALSHHLYVDRRGAPENKQGRFSAVEKAALLKAIAISTSNCGDRVIVSEVNWPLQNTGEWSPVSASYHPKGAKGSKANVTEEQYGQYMIRYLALTICSGMVDQVFWWRLVAHGFGLIDERDPNGWRKRPAFEMLRTFLNELGQATYIEKLDTPKNVYSLRFERPNDIVVLTWCDGQNYSGPFTFDFTIALDSRGKKISLLQIGDDPVYLIQPKE